MSRRRWVYQEVRSQPPDNPRCPGSQIAYQRDGMSVSEFRIACELRMGHVGNHFAHRPGDGRPFVFPNDYWTARATPP